MSVFSNTKKPRNKAVLVFVLCLLCSWAAQPSFVQAQAQGIGVTFLATWQNAWFRAAPSVNAPKVAPLVQGTTYDVAARTEDGQWVALAGPDFPTGTFRKAWLPAGFGQVNGDLARVTVAQYGLPPFGKNTNSAPLPEWIVMTARGKQLYAQAIRAGRDARIFTIAGDSNSTWQRNIGRIAAGQFDFDKYGYPTGTSSLRSVVSRFDPSFARVSVAVHGGIGATDMLKALSVFDPAKAAAAALSMQRGCRVDESMFACELRQSNASIVFIQLGTGDTFAWRDFEANMRGMIQYALANDVLPVPVTKADDMESIQGGASFNFINDTIRKLVVEYQLPLVDFYAATRTMPVVPNPELPKRPFTQFGLQDEWGYYYHLTDEGFTLKVFATLFMLDAITRGI